MPYIIKNGKTYTGNSVTLTQAQYDALSEAEKNNGVAYYIYDSDTVLDASDVGLGTGSVETLAGSVAVIETSPATATHAEGSYIVWNGQLYRVTSAIGVGQTISTATNVSRVTVGEELNSVAIKKVTYTGTTNTAGRIEAGLSEFGIPSGSVIVSVYFERGSYTARRSVEVLMYGTAGYGLLFTDNGTPVNTGSVTATIYYI